MGKILVIAEKPSVGRDIAKVLGCRSRGNGCLFGDDYIITWAVGHLVALASPEELDDKYKNWTRADLPILPKAMKLKVLPRVKRQYDVVSGWMNHEDVDSIICATDSGREGELIFRLIYIMAGCTKPFQRLWISSMTDEAIREGFERLRPGSDYDTLYHSAKCRSEADWLVGMNGSRAFTLTYDTLLSVGRVQSPTLAILVKRELERRAFVPEPYLELTATFTRYKGRWFDPARRGEGTAAFRIDPARREEFERLRDELKGKMGEVIQVDSEERTFKPPQLYDLTSLQRDANRILGFSASKTLRIAQNLYEKRKVITYPRTDSRYLSHDLYKTLKTRLSKLTGGPWEPFATQAMASERKLGGRVVNDARVTDHHAIIPTGKAAGGKGWDEDETALFDLIARRYIAIFLEDQLVEYQTVETVAEGHHFLSKGRLIHQKGWSELYDPLQPKRRRSDEEQELPSLKVGDTKKVSSAKLADKKTEPPAPYTEASLLSAMENAGRELEDEELREQMKDSGLGTPATRAAIIERLIQVRYVRRRGKILTPTDKGITLIQVLPAALSSPETTGRWEKELAEIGRGEADPEAFMEGIRRLVVELVRESGQKNTEVSFPQETRTHDPSAPKVSLGKCPLCESDVLENSKAYYCSQWRSGCRFTVWKNCAKEQEGPLLTPEGMSALLAEKAHTVPEGTFSMVKGKPFVVFTPAIGQAPAPQEAPAGEGQPPWEP